jgi:hypothetical protein
MDPERTAAVAMMQETDEESQEGSMQRLRGWIAVLEVDQRRLSDANEVRAAREREVNLRYLEFVREVLR